MNCKRLLFLFFVALIAFSANAQQHNARETAINWLRNNVQSLGLNSDDIAELRVTDEFTSKHNGVTHVWVQQMYAGTPLNNGLFGIHVLSNGSVMHVGHRFISGISTKINTTIPALSAEQALVLAIATMDFSAPAVPRLLVKADERNMTFEGGQVSRKDIPVSAVYEQTDNGQVVLCWNMAIDQKNTTDLWLISIDATTGQMIRKQNLTTYCKSGHFHRPGDTCENEHAEQKQEQAPQGTSAAETYRVFALPAESPSHGPLTLLTNPADATASPYGWHDTNGQAGPEYTYTRGNNAWAYNDASSDNSGSASESAQGGASLTFDFPFDPNAEPATNANIAITNLFYLNNMMHDITYAYGFDEVSGNFQANNYGHGGSGGDAVNAEALDGGGTDNANFATPNDGSAPRMQMFKWSRSGGNVVVVNAPNDVAGEYYGQAAASWGAPITEVAVTGGVVLATNAGSPLGCEPPEQDLTGKIAMVDRGSCEFGLKALNVENKGAIGCIICNFANSTVGMGPGDVGASVTIPVIMMSKLDCDALKQYANSGLNISLVQPPVSGPDFLDGDFDNGIIAHEYGHGISNRLTGGPSNSGCLSNEEQMGEGWSDFFSLVTSVSPGDNATTRRGVGTYVQREATDGTGIRRYPYTTDINENPLTYSAVADNPEVHALGEVWTAMLWDLYWAMVDQYGYDADWHNTNSGNGRAIQLVMDGMKLQPCSPGFEDGRDAILAADIINYSGVDTCLISKVFARRGLGKFASQGTSASAGDQVENFDPIEVCVKELKIKKLTSTPLIEPGTTASFTITVTNHKDNEVTGVVVEDEVPNGLSPASISSGGTYSNGVITWNLGTIPSGQVRQLSYTAQADMNGSLRLYRDMMDNGDDWFLSSDNQDQQFYLQNSIVKTGTMAWRCDNYSVESDMQLNKAEPITISGVKPTLRFWNRYNTQPGVDAGFLEFNNTTNPNPSWVRVSRAQTFRGGYTGGVSYGTLAIPFHEGFSGSSNGWVQSYVDLSQFDGQTVDFRFRFGSDGASNVDGWYIDDMELLSLVHYDGEACVNSTQGDMACSKAPERGVVVNPGTVSTTEQDRVNGPAIRLQPNPASSFVFVTLLEEVGPLARLSVVDASGRTMYEKTLVQSRAGDSVVLETQNMQAGVYWVRVESAAGVSVRKLVVQ